MVKRTHQDFLPDLSPEENADAPVIVSCDDDVSTVRTHLLPKDLFDTDGAYKRKVNISYLDAKISTRRDWDGLCKSVRHVDCLYLIDDRIVVNPITEDFARMKTLQYVRRFSEDNIPVKIVRKANAHAPNEKYRNTFH